jgi:hypothetical protein
VPRKFHAAAVEGGFRAGSYHCGFGNENASILGKRLAFLLFACVNGKWGGRLDASVELSHVVVNIRLGDQCVGSANVGDKVLEGDCIKSLGGIIESSIIHVVNGRSKLVACDGVDDDVGIPRLSFGKVGSMSCFACRGGSRWIDWILGRCCGGHDECGAVGLKVKNRVLEEAEMSFTMPPRARNGHEVGSKFLLEHLELLVGGLSCDAGESPMWHLGPDGLGRDSVQHS